ncbi:MAG: phosphodiester glycosidase family protein [Spirochaetales bacterium]|nr:phosphodiester glycosidase family protein [Spirochaetales bacterium]
MKCITIQGGMDKDRRVSLLPGRSILLLAGLAFLSLFGCAGGTAVQGMDGNRYGGFWSREGYRPYSPLTEVSPDEGFVPKWHKLYRGIFLAESRKKNPPLAVYCIRIDLHQPGISVIISGGKIRNGVPYFRGMKTTTFLRKYKCVVAINGETFTPYARYEGRPVRLTAGFAVSRGKKYSDEYQREKTSFVITKKGRAAIGADIFRETDIAFALSGWPVVIYPDDPTEIPEQEFLEERHPRSAIGLSIDGRFLYLLVVDGRRPRYSVGLDYKSLVQWLKVHGAYKGINVDGGGSSTLVVAGKRGGPVIVNSVSGGAERVVANHIGIRLSNTK